MMNERAGTQAAPELDLDAIIRTGDRRVWRRRAVGAVGASAAVAAVAFAIPAVVDSVGQDDGAPPIAGRPTAGAFEQRTTTYATGTSIWYGERGIDLSPYRANAFVQTDDGFVVAATDGTVVLADGESVAPIGTTASHPGYATLAVDDQDSYVTWVEPSAQGNDFVVYDTAARAEVARETDPAASSGDRPAEFALPVVEALDEGVAYWHRSDGTVAFDIASGETTMLERGASPDWLKDVQSGTLAFSSFDDQAVVVSSDPSAEGPLVSGYTEDAHLSPDARYLATDRDGVIEVVEVSSGQDLAFDRLAQPGDFVQWLSDDSFLVLDEAAGDLGECSLALQSCGTTAAAPGGSIVLPGGVPGA